MLAVKLLTCNTLEGLPLAPSRLFVERSLCESPESMNRPSIRLDRLEGRAESLSYCPVAPGSRAHTRSKHRFSTSISIPSSPAAPCSRWDYPPLREFRRRRSKCLQQLRPRPSAPTDPPSRRSELAGESSDPFRRSPSIPPSYSFSFGMKPCTTRMNSRAY
jgi:hypothetical protein